jgi:hypothetical protein
VGAAAASSARASGTAKRDAVFILFLDQIERLS